MNRLPALLLAVLLGTTACVTAPVKKPQPVEEQTQGLASWYGQEFAGRTTANGEIFDPLLLTAAHRTLPFGSVVEVRNLQNQKRVRVRINDRGPFINGRIIDLSYAAAQSLGLVERGIGEVELKVLTRAGDREPPAPYIVEVQPRPVEPPAPETISALPVIPQETAPPPVPVIAETGPSVDAPLSEPPSDEPVVDRIDVIEERDGVVVRREVADDGVTIVTKPVEGEAAPPAPVREMTPVPSPAPPVARAETRDRLQRPGAGSASATGDFMVQLGAFSKEQNALDLQKRVGTAAGPVFVERKEQLFRVRVGPFRSREAALAARKKLEEAGFSGLVIPATQ